MRLKNTSRLAGDRDAAGGVLASKVIWLLGQIALHICQEAVTPSRVLLVSASPFAQYLKLIKDVTYPFLSNVSKDIQDLIRLLEPQNSIYHR